MWNRGIRKSVFIQIPFCYFSKNSIKNAVLPTVLIYTILQILHIYSLAFDDLICGNYQTIAMIVSLE